MPFYHIDRIIYSLVYELPPHPGFVGRELIVPLKEDGASERDDILPLPPNERLVTTKPGQEILVRGVREKVLAVEPYRCLPSIPGGRSSRG